MTAVKTFGTSLLAWSGGIALTAATALWLASVHGPLPTLVPGSQEGASAKVSTAGEGRWLGMRLEDAPLPSRGLAGARVLVREVELRSPTAQAGLRPGDAILFVQDQLVTSAHQTVELLNSVPPDGKLALELVRSGRYLNLTIDLRKGP